MALSPRRKKILKRSGWVLLIIAVVLGSFHIWFVNHAEQVIEELVAENSHGKIRLKLKKFRFNYFSHKMELQKAQFITTDTTEANSAYRFNAERIKLELHSFWTLVFQGKPTFDSLILIHPQVEAIRLKSISNNPDEDVSVSKEMGKIWFSINDALNVLEVKRFRVDNGTFTIINKIDTEKKPVTISNIHFLIDKTINEIGDEKKTYTEDPGNMILRTHDQDILLPDGRHRISFRNFYINIKTSQIAIDSCTISAEKTDSTKAAFTVLFDTLNLTNVDFMALYKNDLVKADTVYCSKPELKLTLESKRKKGSPKPAFSIEKLIQQLTGDLQFRYVAVNDAAINIAATHNNHTTVFTSSDDDIAIQDLRIKSDSAKPLSVDNFSMAIRNYETLSQDSTLSFKLDSIQFTNDKVILSNFSVNSLPGKKKLNIERHYFVPRFVLEDLSWDDLLFNEVVAARKAVLFDPVMNYSKQSSPFKKRQNIFKLLSSIDPRMELQQLAIVNGQLNLQLDQRTSISLQNADLNVASNDLLRSKDIQGIQYSVNQLHFLKGVITINNLKAELKDVQFTGDEQQLKARQLLVYDEANTVKAFSNDVIIDELFYNDSTKNISVEGLRWQNGNVNLAALPQPSKSSHTSLVLKNIQGNHTSVSIKNKTGLITTNVTSVSLDELIKLPGARSRLKGLQVNGENLDIIYPDSWIESQHYFFNDHNNSALLNSRYQKSSESNSIVVTSPSIRFVPDVEEILNGHFRFDKINIDTPFIHINIKKPVTDSSVKTNLPDLSVKQLIINQPKFLFEKNNSQGLNKIQWANTVSQSSTNQWQAQNLVINNTNSTITADELSMQTSRMLFSSGGKKWGVDSGLVQVDAKKLEANIDQSGKFKWSLLVKSAALNNPLPLSIGRKQATLLLDDVSAGNMQLTNENIRSLTQLISHNTGLQFTNKKGKLLDGKNIFQWDNAILDPTAKNLVADSFSYSPASDKDSFIAAHPFQTDYITAKTGRITLQNINLANYINDSTLNASLLSVTNSVIDVYRDKRKPFNKGQIKLLPTALLKRIPERINIDTVNLDDATINYTELNDKTNKAGTLLFNQTNAQLLHTRSYDIADTDSLRLFANSKFQDKIPVILNIEESYSDSLSRFRMQASIEKADMKILNPVLIPLASVKLKSGYLDTLNMNVLADDSLAYGEMNIRYHQLKIQVLTKGDENKKTLRNRLLNFIANTFVVKKNNRNRTGIIYYLRDRDRSIFNYMAKMLLNGVSTSTGFKKEKRKQRRIYQQLIQKNLHGS